MCIQERKIRLFDDTTTDTANDIFVSEVLYQNDDIILGKIDVEDIDGMSNNDSYVIISKSTGEVAGAGLQFYYVDRNTID